MKYPAKGASVAVWQQRTGTADGIIKEGKCVIYCTYPESVCNVSTNVAHPQVIVMYRYWNIVFTN
jgi:hypothetical protein